MSTPKRASILLIGTDRYVIDAALRQDLEVVVVRGFPAYDAGQVRIPDQVREILVEDQRNPEAVLAALDRAGLAEHGRFAAIQTSYELSLAAAGLIAERLGARAVDAGTAVRFRDKWIQKREVRAAGIPVTDSVFIDDVRELERAEDLPFERAVLKPAAGAGTALTKVVRDVEELRAAARGLRESQPGARHFVLEEFVAGEEWLADGVLVDGRVEFLSLAAYAQPCLAMLESKAPCRIHRFDPADDAWVYAAADAIVRDALAALGLRDGVFHMELFRRHEDGSIVFSECGARRGGALIHEEVLCKFGIDLAEAAVLCALGEKPDLTPRIRPGAVGTTYLNGRPGTLISCPAPDDILDQSGVEFVRVDMPIGSTVPKSIEDTNTRIGVALLTAENTDALVKQMDALTEWFDSTCVIAPAGATKRELIRWQQQTWPDAGFGDRLYTQR
jgi:biotin carboxylase